MRAVAKINVFLKIVSRRSNYHELISRFIRYEELYDEIYLEEAEEFDIVGIDIDKQSNTIYKAYQALQAVAPEIKDFMQNRRVRIIKRIPEGAGLGGGSSNAATFLLLLNQEAGLHLDTPTLAKVGLQVGADVPFFIYGYKAANVKGIGEIIEPFEDDIPALEIKLMHIHCNTAKVYQNFRKHFQLSDKNQAQQLTKMTSKEILSTLLPLQANDLYKSAMALCPSLAPFANRWYLSGSGSTLFRSKE